MYSCDVINVSMLDSRLYKFGEQLIRVTRFPQLSFGHICLDWHMTHQIAKREGSYVYFIPPEKQINTGVFELKCNDTVVIPDSDMPAMECCTRIFAGEPTFPYYRRKLIAPGLSLSIPENKLEELGDLSRKIGLDLNSKIVCIHVREFGWYQQIGHESATLDTETYPTNARVSSYTSAVGYLLSKGYTVVRVGAPSRTAVAGNGVIDLANSPYRTDLLELLCLMKSRFLIASESGIRQAAELFRLPTLTVNAVDALAVYPLGQKDLYILKHILDKQSGRRLSLSDMLSYEYNYAYRDTTRWHYIENSEDEILQAVVEMENLVEGNYIESARQAGFKSAVCAAQKKLWEHCFYVRKWGIDDGFIGDGHMADSFLNNEWEK